MVETILLQHWIFTRFALPFLLVFFILFAILEKTKVLGDKKQINALVSFVIGLIFVGMIFPVEVVTNLILFLTVALVTMFIAIIIWGFATGKSAIETPIVKWIFGIFLVIAIVGAVLWATGFYSPISGWLFGQNWSASFWTNFAFIVAIVVAVVLVLRKGKKE